MTGLGHDAERVGESFSEHALLETRLRTRAAVREIATRVRPGLREEDALAIASEVLAELGLRKGWHKILVRCGPNTIKNFGEASEPGVVLGDNDIFFVDIGPLAGDIGPSAGDMEGDAGATFALGHDPLHQRAARDVEQLWRKVRDHWRVSGCSGVELYRFADERAAAMGWQLNLNLAGHRLSDFPHKAHFTGKLAHVEFPPSSGLWVLELQIRHPERPFGAFFEDLLLSDDEVQALAYDAR